MAWAEFLAPQIMLLSQEQENRMGGKKGREAMEKKKTGFEHICAPCFLRQKESYQASSEDVQA